jgi:glutamate/aspartate transport system permease protein
MNYLGLGRVLQVHRVGDEIYLNWYVTGLGWTIAVALSAWIIALGARSLLGVLRTVPNRWLSGIATGYVELFRNVPLLVQLFIWYFLVPDLLPQPLQDWFKQAWPGNLGLHQRRRVPGPVHRRAGLRAGAHGIQALPGQPGAARAWASACRRSTATCCCRGRIIIPPLTSEFLNIFKNSSVASLIGLMELLAQTKQTAEFSANLFEAFTLATLIYFTLNMSLMLLMRGRKKVACPA